MEVLTDFPERLRVGTTLYIGPQHQPHKSAGIRWMDRVLSLSFAQYTDCDQVGILRNQEAFVRTDDRPALPEDHYYHYQLVGLTVKDEQGQVLGILTEILVTGANDVYIVRDQDGKETLLPAIEAVIKQVDLANQTITAVPPAWLDNEA